jgi:hypothetical protein
MVSSKGDIRKNSQRKKYRSNRGGVRGGAWAIDAFQKYTNEVEQEAKIEEVNRVIDSHQPFTDYTLGKITLNYDHYIVKEPEHWVSSFVNILDRHGEYIYQYQITSKTTNQHIHPITEYKGGGGREAHVDEIIDILQEYKSKCELDHRKYGLILYYRKYPTRTEAAEGPTQQTTQRLLSRVRSSFRAGSKKKKRKKRKKRKKNEKTKKKGK